MAEIPTPTDPARYARLQRIMDAAVIAALASGGSRAEIAARHRITRNGLWKRTQWMR